MFRNLMGAQKKGGILPAGYTQLKYIEGTGTQWIDTLISMNDVYRMWMDVERPIVQTQWNGITIGTFASSGYAQRCSLFYNNDIIQFRFNRFDIKSYDCEKGRLILDFGYSNDFKTMYIYSPIKDTATTTRNYTDLPDSCKIFSVNTNTYTKAKCYGCKIYSSELAFDGIPCINPSNEVGMYDLVSQQFFGNRGTGEFIAGPVIA